MPVDQGFVAGTALCAKAVKDTAARFGSLDILVNNAAQQFTAQEPREISAEHQRPVHPRERRQLHELKSGHRSSWLSLRLHSARLREASYSTAVSEWVLRHSSCQRTTT